MASALSHKGGGGGGAASGPSTVPASQPQPVTVPQPPQVGVTNPSLQAAKQANYNRMSAKYGWPGGQ